MPKQAVCVSPSLCSLSHKMAVIILVLPLSRGDGGGCSEGSSEKQRGQNESEVDREGVDRALSELMQIP